MGRLSDFEINNKNNQSKKVSEQDLRDKFDYYKNMNQQQLNSELFSEVARQKANGTFDFNKLSQMVESLRGSLPEQDYNNIKRILESLR